MGPPLVVSECQRPVCTSASLEKEQDKKKTKKKTKKKIYVRCNLTDVYLSTKTAVDETSILIDPVIDTLM